MNINKQQIENWANIYKDTFVNESLDFSDQDKKDLKSIAADCKKNYRKYKNDGNMFKEFAFEGQALANVWDMVGKLAEILEGGYKPEFVLKYFHAICHSLYTVETHKLPMPTDPRDIR